MQLKLPTGLHYPITVTDLLKRPGDVVAQGESLFAYFYRTTVTEGDGLGNKVDVVRTFPTRFESSVDGTLLEWKIEAGQAIEAPIDVVEIDEPCSHDVQFGGMCANCGKDMTQASYNTDVLDSSRAPIRMVHDNAALTVSQDEATRAEEDAKRRLLASNRLSLVVDLDQTIIHATVDPTVGEWKEDKENPNYDAVKDVRAFQLVEDGPGMRGCWYYIKLRPGLQEFLEVVSSLYELHIYTMGTRSYAQNVANIVDPDRKIFGDRILSRDESGSLTAKNLQRLFPVDTKMVVIIDDRGDVWKWSDNLIKVSPYDFFVGIGDINSSFLPKKQEFKVSYKDKAAEAKKTTSNEQEEGISKEEASNDETNGSTEENKEGDVEGEGEGEGESTLQQLVTMGGGDNPVLLQEQTSQQEEVIAHQVEDRPLLQMQKQLDAEDEVSDTQTTVENGESIRSDDSQDSSKHRHHLLEDNDMELPQLQERLRLLHQNFFEEYNLKRTQSLGGRVTELRGRRAPKKDKSVDLQIVPDIKVLLPQIKRNILGSVVLVFSGVLPLGTDNQNADISLWAKSFGATITSKISSRTTHLVAGRNRTAKVREATRYPRVKIVTVQWLIDSLTQWKKLDEDPYLVPVHPDDRGEPIGSSELLQEPKDPENTDYGSLTSEEEASVSGESDISRLHINTDTYKYNSEEEIKRSAGLDDHSPIGYDAEEQAAVHDELKDFLGSDDEDSESDTDPFPAGLVGEYRKRKRDPDSGSESSVADNEERKSPLSRRIKRSHDRSTSLKEVATTTATATDREMETGRRAVLGSSAEKQENNDADMEDDEDALEREMLAAFDDEGDWDETMAEDEDEGEAKDAR